MNISEKYKDSVFRKLFGDPQHKEGLLSLYNALNETDYRDPEALEINTLEDVVYMGVKNDVSCILDCHMMLLEHQSRFNPNMPIRGFIYYGRLYDKYLERMGARKYGSALVKIPAPRYYVLYNGREDRPDRMVMRLSDAFMGADAAERVGFSDVAKDYEWTAVMLNINFGHNRRLMESCRLLREYAQMVDVIRRYLDEAKAAGAAGKKARKRAIAQGLDECIRRQILADFLRQHKAEVMGMFLTYYNEEEAMEYFKQESFEKGCEQGRVEGRREGREEGRAEGRREGRMQGREEGSELKMISVVRNMYLNRGFDAETISELVEEPAERIDRIVCALQAAPEKSDEEILAALSREKA